MTSSINSLAISSLKLSPDFNLIQDREEFDELLELIRNSNIIACDTETTFTDSFEKRKLMGIAVCIPLPVGNDNVLAYIPFQHKHDELKWDSSNLDGGWLPEILEVLGNTILIFHNAKFDIAVLEKVGMKTPKFYDTMIMSWMEDENKFGHKLEMLGKYVGLPKLGDKMKELTKSFGRWESIPPTAMGKYACRDAEITWKLFKKFYRSLEEQDTKLLELLERENQVTLMIKRMEQRGVRIDVPAARNLAQETRQQMEEAKVRFGYDPMKPGQLAHRLYALPPEGLGFRPESFSRLPSKEFGNRPIMDEKILSRLDHQEVRDVLQYRSWVKADGTWYSGFADKVDSNGRLHPNFKQHGTKTTRWSCEGPNLQQLPRDIRKAPVKKLLRTTDGYELWEFDYSQIEFRLGVVYCEIPELLDYLRSGGDVHSLTAQKIGAYEKFPDEPDNARWCGKQANFLTINGGGAEVLKNQLWKNAKIDVPISYCKEVLKEFHEAYPQWKKVAYMCQRTAEARGYIKYWNGRHRRFDVKWECHKAFNSLIQGGAAQIMIESMLMLDELGYNMVAQVHDAVWIEIPKDDIEVEVPKIKEIMSGWPTEKFELPFPVDTKVLAT